MKHCHANLKSGKKRDEQFGREKNSKQRKRNWLRTKDKLWIERRQTRHIGKGLYKYTGVPRVRIVGPEEH